MSYAEYLERMRAHGAVVESVDESADEELPESEEPVATQESSVELHEEQVDPVWETEPAAAVKFEPLPVEQRGDQEEEPVLESPERKEVRKRKRKRKRKRPNRREEEPASLNVWNS